MPKYEYQARDTAGKLITGTLEAKNREILVERLKESGYYVSEVSEKKSSVLDINVLQKLQRVKTDDLVIFCRELATMVDAGVPLLRSLVLLAYQTDNKALREVIDKVRGSVEGGSSLSGALAQHPKVFSELFVRSVEAGEVGGVLDKVMDKLASYMESSADLKKKIKSALIYPAVLVCIALGLGGFLALFVLPKFASVFQEANIALPLPTLIIIKVGNLGQNYWYLFIIGIVITIVAIVWFLRTSWGKMRFDHYRLKLPVFGKLFLKATAAQFASTLEMLLSSGVPILRSLEVGAKSIDNKFVAQKIRNAREGVRGGKALGESLKETRIFLPMVPDMISIGEESGKLEIMLFKINEFYTREVENLVKGLTALLEPIILLFMGGMVAFLASAIFLPMFRMFQTIK